MEFKNLTGDANWFQPISNASIRREQDWQVVNAVKKR